jgi:hypothetical protein
MATSYKYAPLKTLKWSYGAELELADWPIREPLADGMAIDEGEKHGVNSNGVAVDGTGELYHLGGEILTAPSTEPSGPADQMAWIKNRWPQATVNFRTGLNIHVRVPGLRDDLKRLKRLQAYIHKVMPVVLPIIDALPIPTAQKFPDPVALAGAKRDYLRCKKNHHSLLPEWRHTLQRKARTPKEFFEAEAIHAETGKVHWAIVLRACVNLRQLLQTDTVEFRHFPGSASPEEIFNATLWCKTFIEAAFEGETNSVSAKDLLSCAGPGAGRAWPKFSPYVRWLDEGYFYTSRYHNTPDQVRAHIADWLARYKESA